MCSSDLVTQLAVFCAVIGMFLAVPGIPPWRALVFGTLGIWMASGSAAAFNHLIDERIDKLMARTARRPLATGHLKPRQVLVFAIVLGIISMLVLALLVNVLTAVLTFGGLIGYALVYTAYLKRATPQNIVIGGLAGVIAGARLNFAYAMVGCDVRPDVKWLETSERSTILSRRGSSSDSSG